VHRNSGILEALNSTEFIKYCYKTILRRECNGDESAFWIKAIDAGSLFREDVLIRFLESQEFRDNSPMNMEFVPGGHFYSVVPSQQERNDYLQKNCIVESIPGVSLDDQLQLELLAEIKKYIDEFDFPEFKTETFRYYWKNPAFTRVDGLVLYGIMRYFQPERIIEVGSGFSSCLMLDTNDRYFEGRIQYTFIEPYPELLYSLVRAEDASKNTIIAKKLQDIDSAIFSTLKENDILFIDSTHVSKLGSDVNHALFNVLPNLNPGVIVHFHDIHWPFENLRHWIEEGRAWNECYLMRAFLQYNDSFKIRLFPSYLQEHKKDFLNAAAPKLLIVTAGSIWLQKNK